MVVSFDPSLGGEIRKARPAAIISNNAANRYLLSVHVIPFRSNTEKLYSCQAHVTMSKRTFKSNGRSDCYRLKAKTDQ